MVAKAAFRERTVAEIKRLRRIEVSNPSELVEAHSKLVAEPDTFVQAMNPIFPKQRGAVSFNKYGPITRLRIFNSAREAMLAKVHPYELLRDAVNSMKEPTLGFALVPPAIGFDGRPMHLDLRPLVVAWKEPFEGARVFAYIHQTGASIAMKTWENNAAYEGKTVIGSIPSRRKKIGRHKAELRHVNAIPLMKNLQRQVADFQFYIPLTIRPSEDTEKRRYAKVRFGMPGLKTEEVLPVMWTDCTLVYENILAEVQEWRRRRSSGGANGYWPPSLEFTVIPLISQFGVNMYKRFRNNTLNHFGSKLRDAETNIAIGEMAREFKHGRVFFSERARDGKMEDYDWSV